jgi:16S rRNA G966 N2-methylase RsmD
MFDAGIALKAAIFSGRVQASNDQSLLDIDQKTRTSVLTWRGQFSPQLVEYFIKKNMPRSGVILDPFSGSGTVLYEAAALGHQAIARDINPAAIALAKASSICAVSMQQRAIILEEVEAFATKLKHQTSQKDVALSVKFAARMFLEQSSEFTSTDVVQAFLMSAFGDNTELNIKSINRSVKTTQRLVLCAPETDQHLSVDVGDARDLGLVHGSVDYLITSPPYINVFNYHQNYRPIIQALGHTPLSAARAEIGANRKFRMNRYITVAQYCIDIALFFGEAAQILRDGCAMTIVMGRESNVRGVSFKNGALVAAIASDGLGGEITSWNERSFLNRFGVTIYEDVLTIIPKKNSTDLIEAVGRSVGTEALRYSLNYAPKDRQQDIENAIIASLTVEPSPYVLRENK